MAFGARANLGVARVAASASSITITTTATASAGDLVWIGLGMDNIGTTDGNLGDVTTISDSAGGNTWTVSQYTNGNGAAASGVTGAIIWSRLTNAISSGGTITVNFASAVTDAAAFANKHTVGAAVVVDGSAQVLADDVADPGSITLSGLANVEHLLIRLNASEHESGESASLTRSTSFSYIQDNSLGVTSTTAGTATANISVDGEHRISTSTGDTSNPAETHGFGPYDHAGIFLALKEQSGAYTITAAQGSFTLTGNAAAVTTQRLLTAAQASFALTGNAAALNHGYILSAAQAAFALTGQAANLTAQRVLTAAQASFALTGNAATLTYTSGSTYTMAAAQGSFSLTGQAALLTAQRRITAAQGSFALSGQAAALNHGYYLSTGNGAYTLTGNAANLTAQRLLTAAHGIFVLTGNAATFAYSGATAIDSASELTIGQALRTIVIGQQMRTINVRPRQ